MIYELITNILISTNTAIIVNYIYMVTLYPHKDIGWSVIKDTFPYFVVCLCLMIIFLKVA